MFHRRYHPRQLGALALIMTPILMQKAINGNAKAESGLVMAASLQLVILPAILKNILLFLQEGWPAIFPCEEESHQY